MFAQTGNPCENVMFVFVLTIFGHQVIVCSNVMCSMAPAEVKREGDDYDIPNEADDIRLMNESRVEPYHGCEAGPSNEEATNMNVEDGGADVKKEMVDDAHRNDMVGDVERAILEQKFDSVEDGEDFYNAYAKAKGFSIRKSRFNTNKEGKVVSRLWLCSREGQRLPKYLDRVAEKSRAPKALTRVGCKAQFRIRYDADAGEGGKYVVTHFVADHNHELAEQHCVMYLRSHRSLNSGDKAQAMAMRNVGVKTSQIMDYMVNQSGSYENVGFIRTDLHNHIQAERRAEVEDGDAQGALVYLCAKLDVDARFFYKYDVCNDNKLQNLFWADSKSRADYAKFGDVLIFDSTYRTNAYKKPFVMLAGVTSHFRTTIFACVLLANKTIETYTWVLETFMEAMGNKAPVSVLTDGDKSMREAIRRVFPDARHRLCNWHLGKNAVSNVHISGFAHAFKQCMDMETDETKFEHGWTTMVEKFGLQTNSWVLETYEKRHMWAEAYMRGHFFAGMKSTQRSECMNAYFNPFLQHKLKLYEFVRHYDRALARIRYNEAGDDAETNNTFPVLITPLRDIERHGAELFTRNIFRMFRDEILEEGKLNVKDVFPLPDGQKCYYIHKYKVKDRSWIVTHSPVDAAMRCSCMKFESLGLPCCHMICVMKAENLTQIPPTCVLHRWTRAASKDGQQWPQPSIDSTTTQTARYGILCSSYNEMCFYASQSTEGFKDARDACLLMTSRMKELYERNLNGGNGDKGKHSFRRQFGVEDPDVVKTKGNPGRASSNCRRPRKCGNCKCIGHTKRTCPKVRFSRTVGNNLDADTPHITDREYNAESLPVRCKTGLVDPSTPHIKQRRLFFDVSPDSKQPVGQYGSVEAAVWKNDSNTIDEVNQVIV